jgi:hypothetical protein
MMQGAFPPGRVLLSQPGFAVLCSPPTPSRCRTISQGHCLYGQRSSRGGPPQFPCPPSAHPAPHTPEGPSALHLQELRAFLGLRRDQPDSAPSGPLAGLASRGGRIHVMLRAERLLPRHRAFDAPLQCPAFPLCTGSLLPGALALTRTGLTPAGEHELARDRLALNHHLPSWRPALWARSIRSRPDASTYQATRARWMKRQRRGPP